MPVKAYLKATYADGFVLIEDEEDRSRYVDGANVFSDILNQRPRDEHGPMTQLELVTDTETHVIDWTDLPDNARPIRFKNMELIQNGNELIGPYVKSISFGWQATVSGRNTQAVVEVC